MAYIYTTNIRGVNGAYAWYNLKELMKTAGWTVKASSDGTTYFSSSDGITGANAGAGGMGNTNAWFRIQMPAINGIQREFLFQMNDTSGTLIVCRYSYSAKFTGGSPSATVVPTATDQQSIASNVGFTTNDAYKLHCGAMNAAPYGFWVHPQSNGNSAGPIGGMLFEPMVPGTGPALDLDPYIIYVEQSSGGSWNLNNLSGGRVSCGAYFGKGTDYETFGIVSAMALQTSGTANRLFPGGAGSNPYSLDEDIGPILWGHVASPNAAPNGIKGQGMIMKWTGNLKTSGALLSELATGDRIVVQDVNFPFNGVALI